MIQTVTTLLSAVISIIALGTVVFNAGKYGERLNRLDSHVHRIGNEIIPSLVTKEAFDRELAHIKDNLSEIKTELSYNNRVTVLILSKLSSNPMKDLEGV